MTNKPMLSVERELLEELQWHYKPYDDYYHKESGYYCPMCHEEKSKGHDATCEIKAVFDKTAAQHQGEPVAYVIESHLSSLLAGEETSIQAWRLPSDGSKVAKRVSLYSDRPAPLKIGSGVTVQNLGFGSEKERKPYLVFGSDGCLTEVNLIDVSLVSKRKVHTIADLEAIGVRVEQPAPVAMVMPERETYTKYLVGVIPHNANEVNAYKDGWNTCLEEVARLNGVKP